MTASPADRPASRRALTVAASVAVLAALVPWGAWAQDRKPVPLVPPWEQDNIRFDRPPPAGAMPDATAPRPPMRATAPARPAPIEAPSVRAEPVRGAPTRIAGPGMVQTEQLDAIDPDSLGLYDQAHGGLAPAMWRNSSRALVRRALAVMPVDSPSHTVHGLARRLLTTIAMPAPPAPDGQDSALLPLRLERLAALGHTDDVAAIIGMMAPVNVTESALRARVDSLFIDGDTTAACGDVGSAIKAFGDVYWQKAFILCQILAGSRAAASTGLDVLRERGHGDPAYFNGIETLLGLHKLSLKSLPDPSPLTVAILRAAKAPFPKDMVKSGSPAVLRAIARSPTADADMRLTAAERAESMGLVDTDQLRDIYRALEFTEAERSTAPTDIAVDKTPRNRALLYQITLMQPDNNTRAGLIARALDLSRGPAFLATARLYQPMVEAMQPGPDLAWFAGRAGRVLLASGRADLAASWLGSAQHFAASSDEAAQAARSLLPLVRVAHAQSDAWSPEALAGWRVAQGEIPPDQIMGRMLLLLNALDAVGEQVSGADWAEVLDGPGLHAAQLPALPVWHALTQAAVDNRMGEAVVLSVIALGGKHPGAVDPSTLHHVVAALRMVGLEPEGRALATEALLANGL